MTEKNKSNDNSLEAEIARLKAENEALKAKAVKAATISMKVSEKGALSIYGLGRFPVSLYAAQWERLLEKAETIKAFLVEHKDELATKPTAQA